VPPRTWVSVDGGGFQQVGTPGEEAGFGGQRPRRTVGWTGRVGVGSIVVIGIVAAVLVTVLIPSSTLWTSGIVCNSRSHLAYSESFSLGQGTSRTFQCVSGDSAYGASKLAIYALQTLATALVLCGTVAAGRLTWRLSRKRSLTYIVIAVCLVGPLVLDLAAVAKWQESFGLTQVPRGGSLSLDEVFTTKTIACNDGDLRVGGVFMTVTVTGHCRRLTVDGIGDQVSVGTVDFTIGGGIANTIQHR
jgi:hypothetical protein